MHSGFGLTEDANCSQHLSYAILRISKNRAGRKNSCMKTTILKTMPSTNPKVRTQMNHASPPRALVLVALFVACFALSPQAQAVCEDGCNNGLFNTWQGDDALTNDTTGAGNTAFGWRSLFSNTDGSFNTGIGGGALVLNNGTSNTEVGAAALLLNTTGSLNTAVGTDALAFNDTGGSSSALCYFALMNQTTTSSNTAVGFEAQLNTTTGFNNAAFGIRAMEFNVDGTNNTALGNLALNSSASTSDHVCVGRLAGQSITTADNNVIIGHHSGVHSVFGQVSDRCFIDNIHDAPVSSAGSPAFVLVDSDGRLGTVIVEGPDPGGFSPKGIKPEAVPDAARQAMLNLKVQALEATVAELRVQLQEQAAQIQKVSALLQLNNSAGRTVASDH